MQSATDLKASRDELRARGLDFTDQARTRVWRWLYTARFRRLAPVPQLEKSWDVANAVRLIEHHVPDRVSPVLDMGCFNSEVLYALHGLGYRVLHGCDLNPLCRWMPFWTRIQYTVADLTATPYPDRSFAALTCLSVVEHGVAVDRFAAEARRLLLPNGLLVLTTDFDGTGGAHHIPAEFRVFGQPWRLYDPAALRELIGRFEAVGFSLLDPASIGAAHTDRPINWYGQDYTFALVALRGPIS